jgi:hypothetical protein
MNLKKIISLSKLSRKDPKLTPKFIAAMIEFLMTNCKKIDYYNSDDNFKKHFEEICNINRFDTEKGIFLRKIQASHDTQDLFYEVRDFFEKILNKSKQIKQKDYAAEASSITKDEFEEEGREDWEAEEEWITAISNEVEIESYAIRKLPGFYILIISCFNMDNIYIFKSRT